jgi:uncharacterized protein (DUF2236 family)
VTPSDAGLYGPESITWRVHGDPSMGLAGLRALLLQAVHPLAMAGVAHHSDFRQDPWGRLRRTAEYVGVTTFGTTAEARRAGARVRGIHRKLTFPDPLTGEVLRVDDPALLLWVHCVEAESFLSTAVRSGLRLSPAEQDAYYAEQVRGAALVGLKEAPDSVAAMAEYFTSVRPSLRVTAEARATARFVLFPPMPLLATPARPAWAGIATAAFCLLPGWARRLYRLPGLPTTDVGAALFSRAFRAGVQALPDGPHYKDAKSRLGLS